MNEITPIPVSSLAPIDYRGERVITLSMMDQVHGRRDATARKRFNDHKSKMVEGRHHFVLNSDEAARLTGTIAPIDYRGERVITLVMMDQVHGRPKDTARRNFNTHKSKMIEGRHHFVLNPSEAASLTGTIAPNGLTILTERGYLMLVKSFTDSFAWKVQDQLVEGYFRGQALAVGPQSLSPAVASQVQSMITAMVPDIVAAVVRSIIPDLVDADLSKRRIAMSYGKTSGQLLRRVHGIEKPPRGMAQKYSRLLVESGCQSGRGELGDGSAKVFDQDKACALWKMGHRDWANKYLQDRSGQMSLELISRVSKPKEKQED